MGNGASNSVKTFKIRQPSEEPSHQNLKNNWRSNSDSCIVDSLSSSKTKADLLQQKLEECENQLKKETTRANEAESKAAKLLKQMAEVEKRNFELSDQISDLEDQLETFTQDRQSAQDKEFEEILDSKDQSIESLKRTMSQLEEETKKIKAKYKKKIKSTLTKIAEVKQESALKIYALKQEIAKFEEDRANSGTKKLEAKEETGLEGNSSMGGEDTRTRLVLELSTQLSVQDERITSLEAEIMEKDQIIRELQKSQSGMKNSPRNKVRAPGAVAFPARSEEGKTQSFNDLEQFPVSQLNGTTKPRASSSAHSRSASAKLKDPTSEAKAQKTSSTRRGRISSKKKKDYYEVDEMWLAVSGMNSEHHSQEVTVADT